MAVSMNTGTRLALFEQIIVPHLSAAYNLAVWLTRNAETDHPVNRRDPVRSGGGSIRERVREAVRLFPSNGQVGVVIQKLDPILNGWCTYFGVGNSNRTFHKVDWAARSELQLWLRRKHQCPWRTAKRRWG
jgi:hypothetical protein